MITVIIVDDHPVVRKALRSALELQADLEVLGEAADRQVALELVREVRPKVVIMDAKMAPMDGFVTTARLRQMPTESQIIILSLYDNPQARLRAEQMGAVAFVSKHEPIETLLAAIHNLALHS